MKFRDRETGVTCLTIRTAVLRFCGHNPCPECPLFRFKNHGCHNWAEEHPAESARLMGYEVIDDLSSDSSTEIDDTPTNTPTTLDDTPTEEGDMNKTNKPLSEWTVERVKRLCSERVDCIGCPAYIQDKCVFWKCDNPQAWRVNETDIDVARKSDASDKPRLAEVLGVEVGEKFQVSGWEDGNGGYWIDENGDIDNTTHAGISIIMLVDIINHPESIIRTPHLTEPEIAIMRAVRAKWVSREPYDEYVDLWLGRPELVGGRFNGPNGSMTIGRIATYLFPSVTPCALLEVPE